MATFASTTHAVGVDVTLHAFVPLAVNSTVLLQASTLSFIESNANAGTSILTRVRMTNVVQFSGGFVDAFGRLISQRTLAVRFCSHGYTCSTILAVFWSTDLVMIAILAKIA